jgi:hypothetical protein
MKTFFDSRASGTILYARVKIFLAFFEKTLLMMPTCPYRVMSYFILGCTLH